MTNIVNDCVRQSAGELCIRREIFDDGFRQRHHPYSASGCSRCIPWRVPCLFLKKFLLYFIVSNYLTILTFHPYYFIGNFLLDLSVSFFITNLNCRALSSQASSAPTTDKLCKASHWFTERILHWCMIPTSCHVEVALGKLFSWDKKLIIFHHKNNMELSLPVMGWQT